MTKYDDLIKQEKENSRLREDLQEDRERWQHERKRSYIHTFMNELPEFHQALLKNNIWTEFEYFHKKLFLPVRDKIQGVYLISADGDGHTRSNCWIGKDGLYYLSSNYNSTADTLISAEELAEIFYDRAIQGIRYFSGDKEFQDAVKRDDYAEAVFQYFSIVIRYNNRYNS